MAVRRISFTIFLDFITASGPSKLSRVRSAIAMYAAEDYSRADYYLDLRHAITRCFGDDGIGALDACLTNLADERKRPHYSAVFAGLRKWIGRKTFDSSFAVPAQDWTSGDLAVTIRPELGLVHRGEKLVIKLYLKDEALSQHRVNPALHLLNETHGTIGTIAILDVRRAKLFKRTRAVRDMDAFLAAEAQSFVTLWNSLAA